ncbi:unnamed protein product, partial [marine sediment metagenome]
MFLLIKYRFPSQLLCSNISCDLSSPMTCFTSGEIAWAMMP